ncbi:MAG TPA: hypothetical protein VFG00_00385 [Acidothermaceae bacterium]|nr:hypothetical protein [Acidothermaceae bacterium]
MPVDVLDPVVGDPMAVSAAGRTLESIALDVASIANRLRTLAAGDDSWTGAAAVSAHVRTASLPPSLDKATVSYTAAGRALGSYARTLADAQDQSTSAIAAADRASAELAAAVSAHAAAAARDTSAFAIAHAAGLPPPSALAPRYEAAMDEAAAQFKRAVASNDDAHEQQRNAARIAAAALQQASHAGIHNQSWFHHVTHSVGHWASTHWTATLREVSKVGTIVSALAGAAALILVVAGVAFPPLEAAAAALETVSLVSAVAAGMADSALAATGKASWTSVGVDALSFAPAGLGKLVTKAGPLIRESRLLKPTAVVHASNGDAARLRSLTTLGHPPSATGDLRVINCVPQGANPRWGMTAIHVDKHFLGGGPFALSRIDPAGSVETWLNHLRELASRPVTKTLDSGLQDIMGTFGKADASGSFRLGIRISPREDGSFDLVTVLTGQRTRRHV